jgi:hypothetical protein
MGETYAQRDRELIRLGFGSYQSYLRSDLWDIIRREVLHRDGCECRMPGCERNGPKQAHHLSYSRAALLGVDPCCLITVCVRHHELCENTGAKKLPLEAVVEKSFRLLFQERRVEPERVANWFMGQRRANKTTARRIVYRLSQSAPLWYNVVMSELSAGTLPASFRRYLLG